MLLRSAGSSVWLWVGIIEVAFCSEATASLMFFSRETKSERSCLRETSSPLMAAVSCLSSSRKFPSSAGSSIWPWGAIMSPESIFSCRVKTFSLRRVFSSLSLKKISATSSRKVSTSTMSKPRNLTRNSLSIMSCGVIFIFVSP